MENGTDFSLGGVLKHFDKYLGLVGLAGSVATTIAKGWETSSFVFVGLAAVFLAAFLVRVILAARRDKDPRGSWMVASAAVGLLVLFAGVAGWTWWTLTKPAVVITAVHVDTNAGLRELLLAYEPVKNGTMDVSVAVDRYGEGDQEIGTFIQRSLAAGDRCSPARMDIVVESRTDRRVTVHGARVRVMRAAGLTDCLAYGEPPTLGKKSSMELDPWSGGDLLPADMGSAEVTPDQPVQIIEILLANDDSDRPADVFGALAVGLYDIQVEIEYGDQRRVATYKDLLIAIPTLEYSLLKRGDVWFERESPDEALDACRSGNVERARAILALAEETETDSWLNQNLLPAYRKAVALLEP